MSPDDVLRFDHPPSLDEVAAEVERVKGKSAAAIYRASMALWLEGPRDAEGFARMDMDTVLDKVVEMGLWQDFESHD